MIDPIQQALQEGALALEKSSAAARGWVGRVARTATSVGNEEHSLVEATLRAENLARKLASSSGRRNCAGVFGPSQAGKSYLVSVLGRSKTAPLIADFAGDEKNFIQEINPAGGKESTGLVTRFTIVKGTRDTTHPVELRMLTETDLVKILGNSFLSDFDQHSRELKLAEEKTIRDAIVRLEAQAKAPARHLDEVRMFDIGEYFKTNYPTSIGALSRAGYWDALTRFGHRLPTAARCELYSQLWGGTEDITRVFKLMQEALERLGHALDARAVIDCLVPRERSIIDVDVLRLFLGTEEDRKDLIGVVPELADGTDGPVVEIARATLCALVAELKVVMKTQPWPFFDHTDLLDFPGARSREQMRSLSKDADTRAAEVRNMVRRGKVSYLFQRYTEERELACMLLCMPPKPAEVKDLTGLVRFWVSQTHGDTSQARSRLPCALFFVLTWFDEELKHRPSDKPESLSLRIEARLEASMNGLYQHEDWLQDWSGKPFDNTYFLRNPAFPLDGVFEYEGDGEDRHEVAISPGSVARLATIRKGVTEHELSTRHFANPGKSWDSALAFNDGGVAWLVENLERVLSPKLKSSQLAGRLMDQSRVLDSRLRRFYQADDDASRKEKEDALLMLRRRMYKASSERGFRNFVHMLGCMMLSEAEVRGAFLNVGSMKLETAAAEAAPEVELDDDPWATGPTDSITSATPAAPVRQRDRYDHFATQVMNLWTERVRGLTTQPVTLNALAFDAQVVGDMGNELVIGAHRNGLAERIANNVRTQVSAANLRWDEVADRCAGIATMLVNDYVAYLGYGDLPPDKRPAFPEAPQQRVRAVFAGPAMPAAGSIPELGQRRVALEHQYFMDWGVSLKQLGLDNISFSGGREIGEEDNRALGGILAGLVPAMNASAP